MYTFYQIHIMSLESNFYGKTIITNNCTLNTMQLLEQGRRGEKGAERCFGLFDYLEITSKPRSWEKGFVPRGPRHHRRWEQELNIFGIRPPNLSHLQLHRGEGDAVAGNPRWLF